MKVSRRNVSNTGLKMAACYAQKKYCFYRVIVLLFLPSQGKIKTEECVYVCIIYYICQESLSFPNLNDFGRFLFLLFFSVSECILYSEFLEELKSGVYQAAKCTVSGSADCREAPACRR